MHVALAALQVGKVTGLVVHIQDLLVALGVESAETLASWSAQSLLEVGVESTPSSGSALRDTILLIYSLDAARSVVLGVKVVQGLGEACADTMLLIKVERSFDGLVADHVTVCKVLGEDARARLVLLGNIVTSLIGVTGSVTTSGLVQ